MIINIAMLLFDIADSNKDDVVPLLSCSEVSSNFPLSFPFRIFTYIFEYYHQKKKKEY